METPSINLTGNVNIWTYIGMMLNKFGPMTEQMMIDINTETDIVAYFEFVSAFSAMEEKRLIETVTKRGESCWALTEKGIASLMPFENDLPKYIPVKTFETGKKLLDKAELERSIICRVLEEKGRYYVSIRFLNETNGEDIMNVRLNSPSKEQAEVVAARFLTRPNDIVTKFMNMLLREDYFMY